MTSTDNMFQTSATSISYTTSLYTSNTYTVKPVLRGHLWDKEKVDL